jgi:predicted metal-dependent phosphoesterase TrpH
VEIDMHVHTSVSSPCSTIPPERVIERAMKVGLDAVCVTEHDHIEGAEVARGLGERYGFKVFRGIEVYTDFGDMLVYGLYRDPPSWNTPFTELLRMCEESGAVIAPAHPCRVSGELVEVHGEEAVRWLLERVDAVESPNGGCSPEGNRAAEEIARRAGLPTIGGSDAHHEFQIGRCYTVFDRDITTESELVQALKEGRCRGACRR